MAKELKIQLGGEEKTLLFRRLSLLKYAEEALNGDDPLVLINEQKPSDRYRMIYAFVLAGLRCSGSKDPAETIDEWVQDMSFEDAALVIDTVVEAMLGGNGKVGEREARELVSQ